MFFRAQDDLTNDLQKQLILRLGELTGRPKTSSLHIHPLLNSAPGLGGDDPEISSIDSKDTAKYFRNSTSPQNPVSSRQVNLKKQNNSQWHSDISFEPVPADFTSLRLIELPETGGGKFWWKIPSLCTNSRNCRKYTHTYTALLIQTLFGHLVMSYMIASVNRIRNFWRA